MKGFNFLKKSKESSSTGWEEVAAMETQFKGDSHEVGAISPDVARMQEQAQRLKAMQEAREQAMKAFDKNFEKMNKTAGADKYFGGRA